MMIKWAPWSDGEKFIGGNALRFHLHAKYAKNMKQNKTNPSPTFNDKDAKSLVIELFDRIRSSKTLDDLNLIPKNFMHGEFLEKNMPGDKFPRLRLRITDAEVNTLKQMGVLSEQMQLSPDLANGVLAHGKTLSPLEKLLYSVLWKNGDLGKEHHLISGILGNGHNQKFGAVFYEFGGYVSGKHSYILDQHTLRCFAIYESSDETIASARSLELIDGTNPKHIDWMNSYKEFYEAISTDILCDKSDFLYSVDRLLFGAGKLIKLTKSAKAKRVSL